MKSGSCYPKCNNLEVVCVLYYYFCLFHVLFILLFAIFVDCWHFDTTLTLCNYALHCILNTCDRRGLVVTSRL